MKTDLYTKTMLTLIVLFLGILSFDKIYDSFIREAEASTKKWRCTTESVRGIKSENFHIGLEELGVQQVEMVEDRVGGGILVCRF